MSTVATFTVRDLSRRTAELLNAVRKYGVVEVTARTGEVFMIEPKSAKTRTRRTGKANAVSEFAKEMEARKARMIAAGYVPPKPGEWDEERFNRIIAGEE